MSPCSSSTSAATVVWPSGVAPADLNALVERYFGSFLDRITDAGGDINETSGDGFMAIFQDGDPAAHAARTVNAALRFAGPDRGAEPEGGRVSARHPHRDQFRAGPGGLHPLRGPARHPLFIASGIVTTLAARLASSAGDGEILAGPETVRRLGGRYRLERVGRERLKNLAEAIEVHRIISPPSRR